MDRLLRFLITSTAFSLCLFYTPSQVWAQCENPSVDLPDANNDVDGNLDNGYCVTITFDPAETGYPDGLSLDLAHTFQGDLSLVVEVDGIVLNIFQRPGAVGNCTGGCTCGSAANLGIGGVTPSTYIFSDTGTIDPETIMPEGGGTFGITMDDGCGVGTPGVNSFADLWAQFPDPGPLTANICITDHAFADVGVAQDITLLFPTPVECGCTDPDALNYDPDASVDDGSCIYDCPPITLTVNEDMYEFCAGDNSFTMTANSPDAVNPTYEWTGTNGGDAFIDNPFSASTDVNIPPDFVGDITYTITVTDELGCEEFIEVEVIVGEPPFVEILGEDTVCPEASVELELDGGPFDNIIWSTGSSSDNISVDAGTYSVTVSDAAGCESIAEFTVDELPPPTPVIFGPDAVCEGEPALLELDQDYVTYEWSNNETTPDIEVYDAGGYSVTITDEDGCEGVANYIVNIDDPVEVEITGPESFCSGEGITIEATPGFVTYTWDDGSPFPDIYVDQPGDYTVFVTNDLGCEGQATINITENDLPEPDINGPEAVCLGEEVILVVTENYEDYVWSTGSEDQSTIVDAGGFYSVTVTDENGCVGFNDFEVIEGETVDAEVQGDLEFCAGTSTEISVTPGYDTYEWAHGPMVDEITVDSEGDYVVTITSVDGCEQILDFFVDENPLPEPEIDGELAICLGETAQLEVVGLYDEYEWSTGDTNFEIGVMDADTYTVTVTDDNGCEGEVSVDLVVNEPIEPTLSGPDALCSNAFGTVSIEGNYTDWEWVDGPSTPNYTVVGPGSYTVMALDINGCAVEGTIDIPEGEAEPIEITGDAQICSNGDGTLTASAGYDTYLWIHNNSDEQSITVTEPGTYTVIGTDADGCETTIDFEVAEVAAPEPTITGDLTVCPGASTELSAEAGFLNYQWSIAGSGNSVTAPGPGMVSVTVTDANGCVGEASTEVTEVPNPEPEILGDLILCETEISTLSLSENYITYQWSTGSTDPTVDIDDPSTITVTVTDAEGCSGSDSATLEEVIPVVAITGDDEFCTGTMTSLSVPDEFESYDWSTGQSSYFINTMTTGTVTITVTDSNGCTAEDMIELTENPLPEVEIEGRLTYCPAGGTELTATPGYVSYEWSNSETTNEVFLNTAGDYSVTVTDSNGCENSTTVTLVEDAELDPMIEGVPSFCAGLSTTLNLTSDFATIEWSTNDSGISTTVNTPGTVTVMVADEFGCEGEATIVIEELPLPEPTIGGDMDYCVGASTTLNAGAGYETYQWSVSGEENQFLEASNPGMYSVTVTDDNGCIGSTSTDVIENPLPVTTILGEPGFCPDLTTVLTAEDGFLAYAWSNGGSGTSIEVGSAETFTLSVTDGNGCVGVATQAVIEYPTEIPAIAGEPQFCPATSTELTAAAGFASYNWSNGATEPTVELSTEGPITVVAMDSNGCVTENTIELSNFVVTPPSIDAVPGFCDGSTAELVAAPGYVSYEWSNAASTSTITVSEGGVYELEVFDNNGCPSEAVVSIEAYDLPEPQIGGSLTFCIGNSTTLNAGTVYSEYQWSTGGTGQEEIVGTPGNVSLTVTDSNGCIGTTGEFVNEATELSPVISGEPDFCFGLSTELDAGTGFATYEWSTGSTASSIVVDEPGVYTLNVTDDGGCAGTATLEVVENPLPEPSINGELDYCVGLSTELIATPGFVTYTWSNDDPTEDITVSSPGLYSVTVTDENDCVNSTSVTVVENALPVFAIDGPTDFCVDSFTNLVVNPAFAEYEWSIGGVDQSVQISNPGIVAVTVTDDNGCQSALSQSLATVPLPLADAGAPQFLDCEVFTVGIGGNGSTTGDAFSYQWTGPGITAANAGELNPMVDSAGMYTLQVINNDFGCVSEAAVVEVADLAYTPQVVIEVLDVLDCATAVVTLDARDSADGPEFIYQWFDEDLNPIPGGNNLLIEVGSAQFYTLQVLDTITNCSNTMGALVEENELYPIAEAGVSQLITCGEPVVTLDGTDSQLGFQITYEWTTPDGTIVGPSDANTAAANAPGWYFLLVSDVLNGCANIDSVFVDQNTVPPVAFSSDDFELDCNFPTTTLSGQGSSLGSNMAYQWLLNGNPVPDATGLQWTTEAPGTYTFLVTNIENECTATAETEITLNPAAPQALNFLTDTPTCAGDDDGAILLTGVEGGTPPFIYSVGGAPYGGGTTYGNLIAGQYDVIVEDATGCLLFTSITVPDGNDLTLELGEDQYLKEGELGDIYPAISVDSSQLVSIDWQTLATLPCEGCITQLDIALEESTQFFLTIQDNNGCVAEDLVTLFVEKDRNVYVPNAFSPDNDGNNDIFHIFSDESVTEIKQFLVFNRWGESVFEIYGSQPNDPAWGWDGTYRGQPVNAAVYVWMAEIEFDNGDVVIFKGDVAIMR